MNKDQGWVYRMEAEIESIDGLQNKRIIERPGDGEIVGDSTGIIATITLWS